MKIKLFFILCILILPATVYAELPNFLREFETQGNINILFSAFHSLALIASDGRYQMLFFSVLVGSFLFGTLNAVSKALAMSFKFEELMAAFFTFIFCGILYAAFISPTTDIVIRDDTTTEFVTVADVPDIVVLLTGLFNFVEQGMVDIVETAATPDSFKDMPNGSMFELFGEMFDDDVNLAGTDNLGEGGKQLLGTYIEHCFSFAIGNPGSGLTIDEIKINNDFGTVLGKGANPAIISGLYDNGGNIMMCDAAWTRVNDYLDTLTNTHPAVIRYMNDNCSKVGWLSSVPGVNGPDRVTTCTNKAMTHISNNYAGVLVDSGHLFRQQLVARQLHSFAKSGDTVSYGNTQVGNKMTGAGLLAQEWIPKIKGMLYGAFICMMPVMILLLVSSAWKHVLMFMIGGLTFFTMWTLCDAMLHSMAMDTALAVMAEIRTNQLGMRSMMHFSSESMKAYAVFGQYKIWSMVLASFFSGGLIKGGSQLGRLGISQAQEARSVGQSAAETMHNPAKNAQAMDSLAGAAPTQAWHNNAGYSGMSKIAAHEQDKKNQSALKEMDTFGGGGGRAADVISDANLNKTTKAVAQDNSMKKEAKASGMTTPKLHQKISDVEAQKSSGDAKGFQQEYAKNHDSPGSESDFQAKLTGTSIMKANQESEAISSVAQNNKMSPDEMLRNNNEYKMAKEASTVKNLDGNHMAVGTNVGKKNAAHAQGDSDHIEVVGMKAERMSAAAQSTEKTSADLLRNSLASFLDRRPMNPAYEQSMKNIQNNPNTRAVFDSIGSKGVAASLDKKRAQRLGDELGYSQNKINNMVGTSALFKIGMNESGGLSFLHMDAKKGTSVLKQNSVQDVYEDSKDTRQGSFNQGGAIQAANKKPDMLIQRMAEAMEQGGEATDIQIDSQARDMAQQISQVHRSEGGITGETNASGSVGIPKGFGIRGGVSTSVKNTESTGHNLHYGALSDLLSNVVDDAEKQGGDPYEALKKGYDEKIAPYINGQLKESREADSGEFGATYAPNGVFEFIKPALGVDAPVENFKPEDHPRTRSIVSEGTKSRGRK